MADDAVGLWVPMLEGMVDFRIGIITLPTGSSMDRSVDGRNNGKGHPGADGIDTYVRQTGIAMGDEGLMPLVQKSVGRGQ
jgi:hypothetical protein